ncbi:hypothetical protein CANINC_001853 [Pichia inconspicua]|uniref:Autophagy-related protein 3 n=1 Tax=Pichia inconspicua TaxID=52247 RepID=A0A4T0X2R5_9ASCO|nr:hypothetical protein CANINC_001853 [[Candida] inconspicua]
MTTNFIRSKISSFREYLTPITHKSTFATTGEITPEEFVKAGDYLTHRFPTWQWSPADESKRKDFLPKDKQFLVTKHVPSYVRAADYELDEKSEVNDIIEVSDDKEEGWSSAGSGSRTNIPLVKTVTNNAELDEMKSNDNEQLDEGSVKEVSSEDESEINDIDELIDEEAEDMEFVDTKKPLNLSKKRYYDLYITYSTSYRVPKMYLVGFNADSTPLTPEEMFEDIASDYRHKTVTIEKAPFLKNTTCVSIHPCKHASVMKVLMKRAAAAMETSRHEKMIKDVSKLGIKDSEHDDNKSDVIDDWEKVSEHESEESGIRVDQYLIVFLKFISSVTPGIEHDYTMEAF